MKLSILDQMPIMKTEAASDALASAIELAKLGDVCGYTRYWAAEHHNTKGLACPAPDIMLGMIGRETSSIRLGSGAVLLPHYKPYQMAERYNLLATLYPGRIDLGLGRAPGGSAEATMALSDNFLEQVKHFPQQVEELQRFLGQSFPEDHTFSSVAPTPVPQTSPVPWILGTSEKSARLAAENGLPYAFGHFMSDKDGPSIIETYRDYFVSADGISPQVIIAVSVVCAESESLAHRYAEEMVSKQLEQMLGYPVARDSASDQDRFMFDNGFKNIIKGTPAHVKQQLKELDNNYKADEYMIVSNILNQRARQTSYRLVMEAFQSIQ